MRALIWGTANAGMSVIISLSMYGIAGRAQAEMDGLAAWRCIALFLGPLTVLLGIGAYFVAGTPREVPFLSDREKRMATARISSNNSGSGRQHTPWSWHQFWDTFRDPQIYIFFTIATINALPNGGTTAFGNVSSVNRSEQAIAKPCLSAYLPVVRIHTTGNLEQRPRGTEPSIHRLLSHHWLHYEEVAKFTVCLHDV